MANTLSSFTVMRTLVRREFWEQRLLFLYAPIVLTLFFMAIQVIVSGRSWQALQAMQAVSSQALLLTGLTPEQISMADEVRRANLLVLMYNAGVGQHLVVFSCMMVYYCLSTLFRQYHSRSILFFSSMPVSDRQTVLSKAISGLVLAHGVYLAWALLMMTMLVIARTLHTSLAGIDLRYPLPSPEPLSERLTNGILLSTLSLLWCLPGYAWLLLCSACARHVPLAWAAAPILAISIPSVLLFNNTDLPAAILGHFVPLFLFDTWNMEASRALQNLGWDNVLLSLVVGLGLLLAAIKLNRVDAD